MASDPDRQKHAVAAAALAWTEAHLERDAIIGIGTGTTADHFIDLLAAHRDRLAGAVASSGRSAQRLERVGIRVFDLDDVGELPVYVDGADEINDRMEMIKGGGGALTREKIVASASRTFVCIADASKQVATLGRFALPIEVIPMARSHVVRAVEKIGGEAGLGPAAIRTRIGPDGTSFVTDNGNLILDVAGWLIADPCAIEAAINGLAGVVECGLFARRPADVLLVAGPDGVREITRAP